jgi:hypothetical protein
MRFMPHAGGPLLPHKQALFLGVEVLLSEPALCAAWRDFQIKPARVSKVFVRDGQNILTVVFIGF